MLASVGVASAAHALSSACTQINTDLNTPHYVFVGGDYYDTSYEGLSNGEYVSWTYSTTGTPSGSSAAVVIYTDLYNVVLVDRDNFRYGNLSESGSFTASNSSDNVQITFNVTQDISPPSNNTLTFRASCAAGPPPSVTSISPIAGTTAGGTPVTIAGTAFSGATGVTIGGVAATNIVVVSTTQITATAPAHAAGAANVVVTTPNGSGTLTSGYLYVAIAFAPPAGGLPGGTIGVSYSQTISASGGTAPYTYSVTPGSLPAGLSLNASTGVISGMPTAAGNYAPRVTATDANSATNSVNYTLAISTAVPGAPTIGSAMAGDSEATVAFTAPASDGGTAVTGYTVTASPGGIAATGLSSPITVTGLANGTAYTFKVTATNSVGTGSASAASNSVTPKATQTITFANPGAQNFGTSPTFSATSDSGLPVTFASTTTGICTVTSGGALTFVTVGTCSIDADQPGSSAYLAASTVSQSFSVNAVVPGAPTIGSATVGPGEATVTFAAAATNGGATITAYTVTSSPGGFTATGASSPITVTGLANGTAYTFTVTATNSVGTGSASAASNSVTPKATQTITFANPGVQTFGTSPTLSVTSDSGLAIAFTSTTTGVCTITSSGALTFVTVGTCSIDADQPGSSAYLAASTVSQSFSVNAVVPGAPTIGSAAAGDGQASVSFAAPVSNGGSVITTYTVTSSPGGFTAAGASSPITVTGLANGTAYTFTVTATNSVGSGSASAASNSVTPTAAVPPPVANNVSAAVAANSSANAIVLNITGGAATSVAVASNPAHGTASAAGTAISYTPAAGYSGADSFTYTATNPSGTSTAATVTITVSAPTFVFSPASGVLAGAIVGTAYSASATASGGTSPYAYAITTGALPAGLTLNSATGAITGAPTTTGTYGFTVTATDANSLSGSAAYTLAVAVPPPVANNVSAAVAANSSANAIALNITGGAATSVAVASNPAHGTASAAGTAISYTPTAGYSGADSLTYTATNPSGTSTAATVTITVSAPTFVFSPASGALAGATVGTAYSASATASGGTSPYAYAITTGALPAGLTLNSATGAITGTPTTAGSYGFTVTATDANSVSGSAAYTLTIAPAAVTLSLSPASGALVDATEGAAYSQSITTSNGTAPYTYSATGLPPGLSINTSSGAITGTPTTAGNVTIAVTVTDSASPANTNTGHYTLTIKPARSFSFSPSGGALKEAMAGELYSQQITATGGSGTLIYSLASGSMPRGLVLNISTGALNGPLDTGTEGDYSFSIAARDSTGASSSAAYTLKVAPRAVSVADQVVDVPAGSTPPNVYLNKNATGGPFAEADIASVEPPTAGTAIIIQGELAAVSTSASPVGWYLKFTPNDAYSGQARVGFRLMSALGVSNTGTITYNLNYDAEKVAADIDSLVHDFVRARQNLLSSSIKVPGLMERRQMANATTPVTTTASPSSEGMALGFSTSLAQMEAARDNGDGAAGGQPSPFNIWIDGAFLAHNDKDINGNKWGNFAIVNMGADYLLSDKALLGFSLHFDRMTDPTDEDATLTGNGWLAGPYASFEMGRNIFWNGSLLYGGSSNTIDTQFWDGNFDTRRWMADTSISGQWLLDAATVLTPKLRAVYFSETIADYAVSNGAGDTIELAGFSEEQLRVSLGAEIARAFILENDGTLTPKLGLTGGFSGLDGSGAFGQVTAGLSLHTPQSLSIETGLLYNIEGGGQQSVGAKIGISGKF